MHAGVKTGIFLSGLLLSAVASAAVPAAQAQAARFLTQATFGPDMAAIDEVLSQGYGPWIDQQIALKPSLHRPDIEVAVLGGVPASAQSPRQELWWRYAMTAPDQLRQRVAFALSEIFVVSDLDPKLDRDPVLMAEYYDILVRGAFDNYRTLLENVTLSPAMGVYLSMIKNGKPDEATGRRADENYAREVMQLFSIGLWELNGDGTPRVDGSGQRVPSYDQDTVENFARTFTGWGWSDASSFYATGSSYKPMKAYEDFHDTGEKMLLQNQPVAAGQTAAQDLRVALDNLFSHPNTGPFISRQLIQRLVTSNPSPGYVARVAQAFNNNGIGIRGDLGAVVRAILLDNEARNAPLRNAGKLREPLLRLSAVWRAFHAAAANGKYDYDHAEREWGQAALRAPSVFNFFSPDHQPPGALSDHGLYAPEFELQSESRSVTLINAWTRYVRRQSDCRGALDPAPEDRTEILLDLCEAMELAANPAQLVDRLDLLLLAGQMPQKMRDGLVQYLESIPANQGLKRARNALFLVASSPQFAAQK